MSNWENGKSLPDIISIIKLSELYKISVDEILLGDKKIQRKIEKDVNVAQTNKMVILVTTVITLVSLAIYFVSVFTGGSFNDFCENAIRWVLSGIGIALAVAFLSNMSKSNKRKLNIGVLAMKKLQIIAIVLLLFGIWLAIFPMAPSSKLPEAISMFTMASGLACGILSLFGNDK